MCFGLVLRVPKNNILAADATDLTAATLQGAARVEKLHGRNEYKRTLAINEFLNYTPGYAQPDLPTPNAVLDQTRVDGHNEVIELGAFAGQVTVTALFVKTSNGMLWEDFLGKEGMIAPVVRQESFNLIPIIPIEDPRGTPSKMPFTVWANGPLQNRRPRKCIELGKVRTAHPTPPMRGHGFGVIPDPCKSGARIILRLPAHEFPRQRLLAVPNGNDREPFVSRRPQG